MLHTAAEGETATKGFCSAGRVSAPVISRGGTYFGEATSSSDLPIYARRTRAGEAWAQLGHGRICKRGHAT